jgi:uncharacterized protein (DUF1499 family)
MTIATAPDSAAGFRFARHLPVLGLGLGVAALGLLAAGPIGWRAGWWSYRIAFTTLMPYAFFAGGVAILVSAPALVFSLKQAARRDLIMAALGLVLGGIAAYFPWHAYAARGVYPPMHDVTTDADNPPSLDFSIAPRRAEAGASPAYPGADAATLQEKFYPGIAPVLLDLPPAQAFDRALALARAKGWTVVAADPASGIIDANDRSFWFGFTDDIAIRVIAAGAGSRIDIRSAARQGRGDYGVNAARVRGFLAALKGSAR